LYWRNFPVTKPVFEKTAEAIYSANKKKCVGWEWKKHELIVEIAEQGKTIM
jgi:hypothetical protein